MSASQDHRLVCLLPATTEAVWVPMTGPSRGRCSCGKWFGPALTHEVFWAWGDHALAESE
jgi:hypothetical protein